MSYLEVVYCQKYLKRKDLNYYSEMITAVLVTGLKRIIQQQCLRLLKC